MNNYTVYHLHSDLSNGVTNIDSVTKYGDYIEKAKELGMSAMAFTEHGTVFEWLHKKEAMEKSGIKYIHGVEAYVTNSLDDKIRDNYHIVLLAKNYDGFLEINKLVSTSYNRQDNHFYYTPRISFDELYKTSDNVIVTTACIGGVLGRSEQYVRQRFLEWGQRNKERFFLEVGHHLSEKQISYNKYLKELSDEYGIRLIAGTDTHALDKVHEKGRSILQKSKKIFFEGEEDWDLTFKSYDELVEAYKNQGSLDESYYLEAIQNTNILADMVEPFEVDKKTKYPSLYENPYEVFEKKVYDAIDTHPYALKNHSRESIEEVVNREIDVYKKTGTVDYMLLQTYLREWEKRNDVQCGYGRGSVSGSMVAYLLGVTEMDSMRFGLNFFRFLNPDRVTNADIDTDYSGTDRDKVKSFLLKDKLGLPNIRTAEIITFNTIATKGAIRDVGRALEIPLSEVDAICKSIEGEDVPEDLRKQYKELFEYVDIVKGTIVSVGSHPSGVLISDMDIEESIGLCTTSTSDYPVSVLNMKELDDLFYVKLDVLGLDGIGVINDTCKMLGIERLTPDNTDLEDKKVWESIRDDTTLIFQWESNSAQAYIRKFLSKSTVEKAKKRSSDFSYLKWLSFGNGLIRPACASFRNDVASGVFNDNGFKELNEFLSNEAGFIVMQETIMNFLVKFCGYSNVESDNVRRAIAKKGGTDSLLPEIERRFIEFSSANYNITKEKCEKIIKPILQALLDASAYAFSWNHSDAYSSVGYINGYLRYYHPYEFLTSALNTFSDNQDKTAEITKYAQKVGIEVTMPKWGISRSTYSFDREKKCIAKDLTSVKHLSSSVAEELYELSKKKNYTKFSELLVDINSQTSLNTRQLDILIKIDFFSSFGNQRELLAISDAFYNLLNKCDAKKISIEKAKESQYEDVIKKYSVNTTKAGKLAKQYTLLDVESILYDIESQIIDSGLPDIEDNIKIKNFKDAMGYVGYVSGKEKERRKLFVLKVTPLKRKSDGKKFGYSINTKSIGSGKEARFTVFSRVYNQDPINEGDIIYCQRYDRQGQYFHLTQYAKLV